MYAGYARVRRGLGAMEGGDGFDILEKGVEGSAPVEASTTDPTPPTWVTAPLNWIQQVVPTLYEQATGSSLPSSSSPTSSPTGTMLPGGGLLTETGEIIVDSAPSSPSGAGAGGEGGAGFEYFAELPAPGGSIPFAPYGSSGGELALEEGGAGGFAVSPVVAIAALLGAGFLAYRLAQAKG